MKKSFKVYYYNSRNVYISRTVKAFGIETAKEEVIRLEGLFKNKINSISSVKAI